MVPLRWIETIALEPQSPLDLIGDPPRQLAARMGTELELLLLKVGDVEDEDVLFLLHRWPRPRCLAWWLPISPSTCRCRRRTTS